MQLELQGLQEVSPKGIPQARTHGPFRGLAWGRLARLEMVQNKVLGLLLLKSKYV